MLFNALDWIVMGLLVLAAVIGFKKGFIKSAGAVVSVIAGLLAALTFWEPTALYLEKNYMIITGVNETIQKVLPMPTFDNLEGMVPSLFESARYAYQGATYHVATLIVSAITFVLILLVVAGILKLIWSVLSILFNWGIMGTINRLGGTAFELAKGVLILSIVVGIAVPIIKGTARTGLPSAVNAQTYLSTSVLVPYLDSIFQLMGRITGV